MEIELNPVVTQPAPSLSLEQLRTANEDTRLRLKGKGVALNPVRTLRTRIELLVQHIFQPFPGKLEEFERAYEQELAALYAQAEADVRKAELVAELDGQLSILDPAEVWQDTPEG